MSLTPKKIGIIAFLLFCVVFGSTLFMVEKIQDAHDADLNRRAYIGCQSGVAILQQLNGERQALRELTKANIAQAEAGANPNTPAYVAKLQALDKTLAPLPSFICEPNGQSHPSPSSIATP